MTLDLTPVARGEFGWIPDEIGFNFSALAADAAEQYKGRPAGGVAGMGAMGGMGATVTSGGVTYQLNYGYNDNTPTYRPDAQVAIQNLMHETYQSNYAPAAFWASAFQQVMGEPYPAAAMQVVTGSYAGTPSAGADVQFSDIWVGYLKATGRWPAMPGVVVPGQYYLAPAPVSNQAPPEPLPASAFTPQGISQQQASAATGQPNQSVPPQSPLNVVPGVEFPVTASQRLTYAYGSDGAASATILPSTLPSWAWILAAGIGAVLLLKGK